jgi:hypothetical protein
MNAWASATDHVITTETATETASICRTNTCSRTATAAMTTDSHAAVRAADAT